MELSKVYEAQKLLQESPLCVRTGMLTKCAPMFKDDANHNSLDSINLNLKLENMQNFGSFKIRGIVNQFDKTVKSGDNSDRELVTMSAGNYGRAFAVACQRMNLKGRVFLPHFSPKSRAEFIRSKGLQAEIVHNTELQDRVDECVKSGSLFMHPYDDAYLFDGYGVIALEIFEDVPHADIVVTCCGGGGVLAGIAFTAKQKSPTCRVYGVEPATANSMYRSFKAGEAVKMPDSTSIASGLSPPYAGKLTYAVCKDNVDDILLVTDEELKFAVKTLYNRGLVVEAAGAAAFAALLFNKVPDVQGKTVVIVLTGRNISPEEMSAIMAS